MGTGQTRSQEAADPAERFYLVLEGTGPNLRPGVPVQQQPGFAEHAEYVTKLSSDGSLVLGGPFTPDGANAPPLGAMLVLKASSAEAARRFAEEDPGVKAGLSRVIEVRHFLVAAGAWVPRK
jgi:uncharacterized protein YciI